MIPTKVEKNVTAEAKKLVTKAGSNIVWSNAILALPWAKVKDSIEYTTKVPTWGIDCITGQIAINPQWTVDNLNAEQCRFLIGHELMHVLMNQFERATRIGAQQADGSPIPGSERNHRIFWESADRVINQILINSKVGTMGPGGLLPDPAYDGKLETEAYYYWALKQPEQPGSKNDGQEPQVGAGCAPKGKPQPKQGNDQQQPKGNPGQPIDWEQVRAEAEEQARQAREGQEEPVVGRKAGRGTTIAQALAPKPVSQDWRRILPNAYDKASAESLNRIHRSYSRASRRTNAIDPNIMLPGKVGGEPTIAIVFDVSSSVSRELVEKAMGQAKRLMGQYPNVSVFVASHTSECVWSGWLKKGGDDKKLIDSTAFSGGTDCRDTYERVREAFKGQKADVLVHFTDCEVPYWPEAPAKYTVIGACGVAPGDEPAALPPNKKLKMIPVDTGGAA